MIGRAAGQRKSGHEGRFFLDGNPWRRGRDSPKSTNLQRRNPELTVQSYTVWFTELMMAGW